MSQYVEITKKAFDALTNVKYDVYAIEELELAVKTYLKACGVVLLIVYNYVSNVNQYYIQDINW